MMFPFSDLEAIREMAVDEVISIISISRFVYKKQMDAVDFAIYTIF